MKSVKRNGGAVMHPSDLLQMLKDGWDPVEVALDTETSGLHVDDGARISTVSVAFEVPEGTPEWVVERLGVSGGTSGAWQTFEVQECGFGGLGESVPRRIYSAAWAFDQGLSYTGKPEDNGQTSLIPDAENLPDEEWWAMCEWLKLLGWRPGCTCHNGYGTIKLWTKPVNTDTSTPNATRTATASRVDMNRTELKGQASQRNDAETDPDTTHSEHMGEPARVVAKNTRATSSSTISTVEGVNTAGKLTTDGTSEEAGIKPTAGSPKTTTPKDFKFCALIATWPRNEAGVPTCPWCLTDAEVRKFLGFSNAKFDLHMTRKGLRTIPNSGIELVNQLLHDTQNGAHLLWGYTGTTGLKPTAERLWGSADDEQQKVKSYLAKSNLPPGRWDLIPWSIIGPYADKDAALTLRLCIHQQLCLKLGVGCEWMDGVDARLTPQKAYQRRMDTTRMLYRIERRGIPFDVAQAGVASRALNKAASQLTKQLPFHPATLPAAKHYWFGSGVNRQGVKGMGLPPISVTEKGEPQLNAYVVQKLAVKGVDGVDTWRQLQKARTANDRWYTGWGSMVGDDGRLRGSVRQNGTVSGRFSINRVQLQAMPHGHRLAGYDVLEGIPTPRGLISAGVPDGFKLWELDLANAELRVASMYANCTRMLKLIKGGHDLHGDTAVELFRVDPSSEDWYKMRSVAKRANFSLIFGVGWETLQSAIDSETGVILSDREAKKLVRDWNALYPQFSRAIKRTMEVVQDRQRKMGNKAYVQAFNAERRWYPYSADAHSAFNQRVQSSLAQYANDWWLRADRYVDTELIREGWGSRLEDVGTVMLIHDSMVLLLPEVAHRGGEGTLGEVVTRGVKDIGERLWARTFPGVPGGVDIDEFDGN